MVYSSPRESLRDRLTQLGIPREAHETAALARMLPVYLNGSALDRLDADALAEALIYLIENEIVRLPTRLEGLRDLEWGAHVCHLYRSRDDLVAFMAAYFRRGLERNEYCVGIAPDAAAAQALRAALAVATPHFDHHDRAFECRTHEAWYLDRTGQLKAADALIADLVQLSDEALRAGYDGLRCAGWVGGVDRRNWPRITDYESAVNARLPGMRIKAVCAYPLLECNGRELADVRNNHEDAIVESAGWWHRVTASEARDAGAVLKALQGAKR